MGEKEVVEVLRTAPQAYLTQASLDVLVDAWRQRGHPRRPGSSRPEERSAELRPPLSHPSEPLRRLAPIAASNRALIRGAKRRALNLQCKRPRDCASA